MMDFQLTLPTSLRRAETYFGDKEIVTRLPDKIFHRYTYADMARRAKQLAVALRELGLERGDRVATLCWNHYQHLEAYFGIPCGGFVLHTLNLRLHPNDIGYIAKHAGDRALIVDARLLPLVDQFKDQHADRARLRRRGLVRGAARVRRSGRVARARARRERGRGDVLHERHDRACRRASSTRTARRCCTRSASPPATRSGSASREQDAILPVVPMFHANAWGYPVHRRDARREAGLPRPASRPGEPARRLRAGARHVDRGRADDLARDPPAARREPGRVGPVAHEGHARRRLGGAARDDRRLPGAPRAARLPRLGDDRDVAGRVDGGAAGRARATRTTRRSSTTSRCRASPLPLVELRARDVDGNEIPRDGETMGELEMRGPVGRAAYYDTPEQAERWTDDGWFKTGDIVSIRPARASSRSRTARRT